MTYPERSGRSARRLWIWVVVAISTLQLFSGAPPAGASVSPCSSFNGYFRDGAQTSWQTGIYGGRARLTPRDTSLCGSASSSLVLVGVTGHVTGGGATNYGWAEVGFGRFGSSSGWDQAGYLRVATYAVRCPPGSCNDNVYFGPAPDGIGLFTTQYKDSDNSIHMYAYGLQMGQTVGDPRAIWDAEWQDYFYGYAAHLGSDIPGIKTDKVQVTNLKKLTNPSTGQWDDISTVYFDTGACRFNSEPLTGSDFAIWTYPLYSTSC